MVDFTGSDHAPVWLDLNIDKPTSSKEFNAQARVQSTLQGQRQRWATADCHFIHSIKPLMGHSNYFFAAAGFTYLCL